MHRYSVFKGSFLYNLDNEAFWSSSFDIMIDEKNKTGVKVIFPSVKYAFLYVNYVKDHSLRKKEGTSEKILE